MNRARFVTALAGVFGAITALLLLLGVTITPVALGVALPFGVGAYLLWYHASGRLEARMREEARQRAAAEERRRAASSASARQRTRSGPGPAGGGQGWRGQSGNQSSTGRDRQRRSSGAAISRVEALAVLDLDTGATQEEIQRAYRERVKEAHPDRGGDEREFQRLTKAYRRLKEDVAAE